MFNYFRKELDWGGRKLVLETGKIARQADGAVLASYGDTIVLCTAVGREKLPPRPGFLPAHGKLPGEGLRRRQDPRRLLQARGPSEREGNPEVPPDRPPDPSAVPGGLPQRGPGRRHGAEPRPGERPRHRRHDRLLCRADALRHPVLRPGRRRSRRLQGRPVHPEPDRRPDEGQPARAGGRRHVGRRADGGIRSPGAVRRRHARRRHLRA